MSFEQAFQTGKYFLTEGSILERLRREFEVDIDEHIASASVIYDKDKSERFESIYKSYIDVAVEQGIPIMIMTSTRRADKERTEKSIYKNKNVIEDNVDFLKSIRADYKEDANKIYIGGILGCKGDAYNPLEALDIEEAKGYHSWQVEAFKEAGVDYLFACIMPALTEAIGMAKAMEASGLPYIISFMIRKNGCLLDGTTIHDAIAQIDAVTTRKPLVYISNCVHPKIMYEALSQVFNQTDLVRTRYLGIHANTSSLSPEELNGADQLCVDSFDELIGYMMRLRKEYDFKIFGGCCGTNEKHIEAIAKGLKIEALQV